MGEAMSKGFSLSKGLELQVAEAVRLFWMTREQQARKQGIRDRETRVPGVP